MSNSLDITPAQARAIVLRAARRNGWISQEDRDNSPLGTLEALENAREQLGDALEIISHDLSSTNARFALELVQNAEDNEFTRAIHLGQQPYIRFRVCPTSIVVECNEDGFIEENVVSISRIGKSSKSKDRGYIGEKGIGFKSVFQVATAVHIQSNSFSFSFRYGEGATRDKLGIVTPILEDECVPIDARPLTRMTLTPFQAEEAIPYASLVAQFQQDIPDNLLLFLSTLQKIEIQCQHPDESSTLTTFRRIEMEDGRMIHLVKSVEDPHRADGNSATGDPPDRYYITKRNIPRLSPHPSRPEIDSCEVVLAFPVDEASRPLISLQSCFAFLPIRRTNFNFIIQADFILPTNREDILHTARNIDILKGVAETFRDAVLQFVSSDSPLRYKWIKYLPGGQSLGRVWEVLPTEIIRLLREEDIVYSQEFPVPCQPNMLRILPPTHLDSSGLPLFHDRPRANRKYLSLRYDPEDIDVLRNVFDLHDIEDIHMYHRVKQDLESGSSKMMDCETDDGWHSRAASLIFSILSRSSSGLVNMIRGLPLIPLNSGEWVKASEGLHFPAVVGPEIPRDLITTVDPNAAANDCRKSLFTRLGVIDVQPRTVVDQLLRHYTRGSGASDFSFSMAHVSYLYWHHENREDHRLALVWLYETNGRQVASRRNLMYFQTEEEYGPYELLKAYEHPGDPSGNIPECPVSFLKSEYMDLFPPATRRHGSSWLKWLEKGLGVRRLPRIKLDGGSLSTEFRHIIRYRPNKIVGTLKKYWDDYVADMNSPIVDTLSHSKVTCIGGQLRVLKDTYLPLQDLKDRVHMLGIGQEFPFLRVSDDLEENIVPRDWRFLDEFEVGFEPDLNFYVEVLRQHNSRRFRTWGSEMRERILKTYEFITDNCSDNQREWLCEEIDTWELILDPCSFQEDASDPTWIDVQSCAWHGPVDLLAKKPLAEVPEYRNNQKLSRFFREILEIEDTTWRDYLEMVSSHRRLAESPPNLSEKVLRLYQLLFNDGRSTPNWTQISERFETEGLIYIPSTSSWVSPSECLWDSPVPIDGKAIILQSYPEELKPFFLERLRISPASLSTLAEELHALATRHPTVRRVKQLIWAINGMSPRLFELNILSTCNFLPVRVPQPGAAYRVDFRACQSDFAIVDRIKLAEIFEDHVELLDFSLEEILQLKPFLGSLGLGAKYLSKLCREETDCQGESWLDNRLTADFNGRAYDLLRCAVSYRSAIATLNAQSMLNQLRSASVFRTNGLSTKHTIQRFGEDVTIQIHSGYVHIKEQENRWSVYVPENGRERALCYSLSFPEALTKLFRISLDARETISNVLSKPVYILDDILKAVGIGMVPDIDPPPRSAAEDSSEEGTDEQDIIATEDAVALSRSSRAQDTPVSSVGGSHLPAAGDQMHLPPAEDQIHNPLAADQVHLPPAEDQVHLPPAEDQMHLPPAEDQMHLPLAEDQMHLPPAEDQMHLPLAEDQMHLPPAADQMHDPPERLSPEIADWRAYSSREAYRNLLENVIRLASQTNLPHFNSRAIAGNNQFLEGFDPVMTFGLRSQGQMYHDTKIGAAGELFVFEMLSRLGLPGFDRPNWESTIRGLVAVHPSYAGMDSWPGRETADITYEDLSGLLTAMLIANGYLEEQVWSGARPGYFIEVKTTTGECGDRLYMSSKQYQLMQQCTFPPDRSAPNIYVIFRVFNLGRNNLSVKLYVDPEAHRLRGDLVFECQTWTARPRA